MSKLHISTQVYENYGTADEPHWKPKGGSDYVIRDFDPLRYAPGVIVDLFRPKVESDSKYFREHIIDWSVEADDYLTEFEQMQLDYEGQIRFPVKELELA